jgi:predicted metal-dependent hydrolase
VSSVRCPCSYARNGVVRTPSATGAGTTLVSVRELDIVVGDETIVAVVRESARSRRMRMVVRAGRPLELTVPRRTSTRALRQFIEDNSDWLGEKLAAARVPRPLLGLAAPGTVWLAGERLGIERGGGVKSVANRLGSTLRISGPPGEIAGAVDRWYRREARERIEASVARESARLGIPYARVSIRDQRTRWGSCSTRGTLSFSWRLVLSPPAVLEYVVDHELLHVRQPNHSRAFWALLDEHRPGWREEAAWLRRHGHEVLDYDPWPNGTYGSGSSSTSGSFRATE